MIQEQKNNKYFKNFIFIIVVLVFTFGYAVDWKELVEIPKILSGLKLQFLLVAIVTMMLFFLCQSLVVKKLLNSFNYKVKLSNCYRYTLIDYYFSAITPGASGGQPAEIYYMKKDGINIGISSVTMLIFNGLYHLSVVLVVFIAGFGNIRSILGDNQIFYRLFQVGIGIQVLLVISFLFLVFSKKLVYILLEKVLAVIRVFNYKKAEALEKKLTFILKEYKESATWLSNNLSIFLKILPIVVIHIALLYSIGYWVGKAFGLKDISLIKMIAYQGIYTMTFESLPIPGGVGLAEAGFLNIFSNLYHNGELAAALLITRGITYYSMIVFGGLFTFLSKGERVSRLKSFKTRAN